MHAYYWNSYFWIPWGIGSWFFFILIIVIIYLIFSENNNESEKNQTSHGPPKVTTLKEGENTEDQIRYCSNCGSKLQSIDQRFCAMCGFKLSEIN